LAHYSTNPVTNTKRIQSKKQKVFKNRNTMIASFLTVLIVADQSETEELAGKTRVAAIANRSTSL